MSLSRSWFACRLLMPSTMRKRHAERKGNREEISDFYGKIMAQISCRTGLTDLESCSYSDQNLPMEEGYDILVAFWRTLPRPLSLTRWAVTIL